MKEWKKWTALLLCWVLLLSCGGTGYAAEKRTDFTGAAALIETLNGAPDVNAGAAVLMDAASGAVLYAKNEKEALYPASITKVMTALLALERCELGDIVTYSADAVYSFEIGGSTAGIPVGAELTVEESLYALLLVSANEAAAALGEHIAGSEAEFAALMTQRAEELGCTDTRFANASGLHDSGHYTTAHDMALILQEALHYEVFRTICGATSYTIPARDSLGESIEMWNHFRMLYSTHQYYYEYAEGGKTGYTEQAGATLVSFAKQGETELLCVVLDDSGEHYTDTEALYQWGFQQVETVTPLGELNLSEVLTGEQYALYERLGCTYDGALQLLLPAETETQVVFQPAEEGASGAIGSLLVQVAGETVLTAPVTYDPTTRAAQAYQEELEQADAPTDSAGESASAAAPEEDGSPAEEQGSALPYLLGLAAVAAVCGAVAVRALRIRGERRRRARNNRRV